MGAYIAAKGAVIRLTETMSAELRSKGVNVNCVMPSIIDTPENRGAMPDATRMLGIAGATRQRHSFSFGRGERRPRHASQFVGLFRTLASGRDPRPVGDGRPFEMSGILVRLMALRGAKSTDCPRPERRRPAGMGIDRFRRCRPIQKFI